MLKHFRLQDEVRKGNFTLVHEAEDPEQFLWPTCCDRMMLRLSKRSCMGKSGGKNHHDIPKSCFLSTFQSGNMMSILYLETQWT